MAASFQKYPKYSLKMVLPIAFAVYKQNKECKVSTLATALNYTTSSSPFIQKKATAKWFSLITEKDDVVKLTDIGGKIVSPLDDSEKNENLKRAFLSFETFKELFEQLPTEVNLTKSKIEILAERECKINVSNKEEFVSIFIESAEISGLLLKIDDLTYKKPSINENLQENTEEVISEDRLDDNTIEDNDINLEMPVKDGMGKVNIICDSPNTLNKPMINININISIDSNTSADVITLVFDKIKSLL